MSCIILFPSQLFENEYIKKVFNEINEVNKYIILWEHDYFFKAFPYHKLKLAFHRASMKYYYDKLPISKTLKIYINSIDEDKLQYEHITQFIKKNNINQLLFFNPIEKKLLKLVMEKKLIPNLDIEYALFPSPYFLNSSNFDKNNKIEEILSSIRHDSFYKNQRITYNIMVNKVNNKVVPEGGSWSFDTENRSSFEKSQKEVDLLIVNTGNKIQYINEAIKYVNDNYPKNYGYCEKANFIYPISRIDGLKWLDDFINRKLSAFGKYEDGIKSDIVFGFHSVLSPITNIGLITPVDIITRVKDYKTNYASKEGFIRQVIGWREYCYFMYDKYSKELETNFFYSKSNKKIPKKIWTGQTQIPIIDNIINKVNKYAYSHHIERLMCMGNFMLLLGISPKEIYNWFQTMYIDAYDVFMVPNVYGMLLYGFISEQNHMMTKPYFCSSNYLIKMSDFKSREIDLDGVKYKWDEIIDALYYKLISDYSDKFSKIYSTALGVKRFSSFTTGKKKQLLDLANIYIKWIFN
jgi:deoxyribodipyrimidine photolyase-related protein